MTTFAIDRKRRWNAAPRRWRGFFLHLTYTDSQIADLIKLNGLQTRISNWQCIPGCGVARPKTVFGVSPFTYADEKFSGFASDTAVHPERVAKVGVAALIERAAQSNPRLHRNQHTLPRNFLNGTTR